MREGRAPREKKEYSKLDGQYGQRPKGESARRSLRRTKEVDVPGSVGKKRLKRDMESALRGLALRAEEFALLSKGVGSDGRY